MAFIMWLQTAFLIFLPNQFLTGRHPHNLIFLYCMLILSMHFFFARYFEYLQHFTHSKIHCKSHLFIVRILLQIIPIIVIYHSTCHLKFSQKMPFFQLPVNSQKQGCFFSEVSATSHITSEHLNYFFLLKRKRCNFMKYRKCFCIEKISRY